MDKKFLEEMLATGSVGGHEIKLQKKVIEHMQGISDEIIKDTIGNVIQVLNPDSDVKILLCGHIDEIGLIITSIQDDGYIKVNKVGGVRPLLYLGTHVDIETKDGIVNGVVIADPSLFKKSDIEAKDLSIDIGAKSKEEALRHVHVGDPVFASTTYRYLLNDRMAARAFDDRIGAFIILEALKKAKAKGAKVGVYAATTVGEETTAHGAYWASQKVKPTLAIAVDVTYTSDYHGVDSSVSGEVALDKGPVLCKGAMISEKINALLEDSAKELGISLQYEVAGGKTMTDADKIHFTNDGVPVALVSIPLRYMHSSIETLSLKDVKDIIDLLAEFLVRYDKDIDLDPFG